jgi:hypothetical protein
MEEMTNAYKILVGIPKGREHSGNEVQMVGYITSNPKEIYWQFVDWIHVAQVGTTGGLFWTQ